MSMNLEAFEGQEVIVHTVGGVHFGGELTLIPTFSGNGAALRLTRYEDLVFGRKAERRHYYLDPANVVAVEVVERDSVVSR